MSEDDDVINDADIVRLRALITGPERAQQFTFCCPFCRQAIRLWPEDVCAHVDACAGRMTALMARPS